jgi:hypothetical protein
MGKGKRKSSRWRSGQQNNRLRAYYASRRVAWGMTGSMASHVIGMGIVVATSGSAWVMGLHLLALFAFTIAAVLAVMSMKKQNRALIRLNRHTHFAQSIAPPDRLRKPY